MAHKPWWQIIKVLQFNHLVHTHKYIWCVNRYINAQRHILEIYDDRIQNWPSLPQYSFIYTCQIEEYPVGSCRNHCTPQLTDFFSYTWNNLFFLSFCWRHPFSLFTNNHDIILCSCLVSFSLINLQISYPTVFSTINFQLTTHTRHESVVLPETHHYKFFFLILKTSHFQKFFTKMIVFLERVNSLKIIPAAYEVIR